MYTLNDSTHDVNSTIPGDMGKSNSLFGKDQKTEQKTREVRESDYRRSSFRSQYFLIASSRRPWARKMR